SLRESFPEDNTELTAPENIGKTISAITKLFNLIKDDRGVDPNNIFVVSSSGASAVPHFAEFKKRLKEENGIETDVVKPDYECELTFRWIVPKYRYNSAVVIDAGSGSVNACYMERTASTFRSFNLLPYGTTRFAAKVGDEMKASQAGTETFADIAKRLR